MKKILSILILFSLLISLISCGKTEYPPVESTEEEARIIATFNFEGEKYELKYELYRALFLSIKETVDGGDNSVWSSDNKLYYEEKINDLIINAAAEIFSVLHHGKKIGIDPYSSEIDGIIEDQIYLGVNGASTSDGSLQGFGGDYNKYLESLKEMYLNYSAHILIYRYAIVYDKIISYYRGNDGDDLSDGVSAGALKFTQNDVFDFYYGDESARVLLTTLDTKSFTEKRAGEIRDKLASFDSEEKIISYAVQFTTTVAEDAEDGIIIGKYSLAGTSTDNLTDAALSLEIGSVSPVIQVFVNFSNFYYILYKTNKTTEYYEENYQKIAEAYVSNEIGRLLSLDKVGIAESVTFSEIYKEIDHYDIKMQ